MKGNALMHHLVHHTRPRRNTTASHQNYVSLSDHLLFSIFSPFRMCAQCAGTWLIIIEKLLAPFPIFFLGAVIIIAKNMNMNKWFTNFPCKFYYHLLLINSKHLRQEFYQQDKLYFYYFTPCSFLKSFFFVVYNK